MLEGGARSAKVNIILPEERSQIFESRAGFDDRRRASGRDAL
jgi:hypothetical protein